MTQDTISKIEDRIRQGETLKGESRAELLELLRQLKAEIAGLSETHRDQAQSIAGYTDVSAHEALRQEQNPQLLQHSIGGLQSSVDQLEKSHPQLVAVVNRIATILSNMGI